MSNSNKDGQFKIAFIGLLGVVLGVIGSVAQDLIKEHYKTKETAALALLDSIKFDRMESKDMYAKQYIDLKQFTDEVRNVSIVNAEVIKGLAQAVRNNPNCGGTLSDECRSLLVKIIQVMREELDNGEVSDEDIDLLIKGKYQKAQKAIEIINNQNLPPQSN
ncbi:MAG: hypothetical protein ABL933_06170 [Methyloglobulus sp.]|nr:hypothetical protein [Methyloglobulus sp.]